MELVETLRVQFGTVWPTLVWSKTCQSPTPVAVTMVFRQRRYRRFIDSEHLISSPAKLAASIKVLKNFLLNAAKRLLIPGGFAEMAHPFLLRYAEATL